MRISDWSSDVCSSDLSTRHARTTTRARPVNDFSDALVRAGGLILGLDPDFLGIVGLSVRVSLTALAIACLIGLPLGAALALLHFPGRSATILVVNTCMGLPPGVVGLFVFLLLSRAGPPGGIGRQNG